MTSDVPAPPKAVIAEGVMPLPASAPAVPAAPAPEPQAAPEPPATESAALPIESLLLRFRMITPAQLADAMKEEAVSGKSVATIVVENGWVTPEAMAQIAPDAPAAPAPAAPAPIFEPVAVEPPVAEVPARAPAPEPAPVAPEPVAPLMPEPVAEQPAPQPEAPVAAAAPLLPFVSEPEPQPETLIEALAPVAEPLPEPEPVAVVEPEPVVVPSAPEPAAQPRVLFQVVACLSNGERIEIARADDADEAKAAATDAMRSLKAGGDWPVFSGRFVRPESIVSIDVAAHL